MRSRTILQRIEKLLSVNCSHCEAPRQFPSLSSVDTPALEAFLAIYFKACPVCGKQKNWLNLIEQCGEL